MRLLYLIPARGGSKGIPHKNIKQLSGKPLIAYSIDVARQLTDDSNICVSTDDDEIIRVVTSYGLAVPLKGLIFLRQIQLVRTRLFCMQSILRKLREEL